MTHERVVCLNCIDGRAQLPVIHWIKEHCDVENVDMITEPGMDGLLAKGEGAVGEVFRKAALSIRVNSAAMMFVVAHHDCRGNPVDPETHKSHLTAAISRLSREFSPVPVTGLWVNDQWQVDKI